jgi:VanZ family protein
MQTAPPQGLPILVRWLPALTEMAILFALSSTPNLRFSEDPALDHVLRKLGHAAAYALLAVLVTWAIGGLRRDPRRALAAFAIVVAYAISDEIHQAFTATRSPSVLDVAVDAAGAGIGILLYRIGERRRAGSRPSAEASGRPPT